MNCDLDRIVQCDFFKESNIYAAYQPHSVFYFHYTVVGCFKMLYKTTRHYSELHCITVYPVLTALHYTTMSYYFLTYSCYTALHCTALLHYTTLHCTILHCTKLHCTIPHSSMTKEKVTAGVQQETLDASMQSVEGLESESAVHSDIPASASAGVKGELLSYIIR